MSNLCQYLTYFNFRWSAWTVVDAAGALEVEVVAALEEAEVEAASEAGEAGALEEAEEGEEEDLEEAGAVEEEEEEAVNSRRVVLMTRV